MILRVLAGCAVVAFSLATLGCPDGSRHSGPARHVIFISLDTTRADHLGCYGNTLVETPNLDRLAEQSIVLDDFMTVATTTLASHTSLFTGKYPHTHGTPRNGFDVNPDNVLLAEILHDLGFTTAGFVASFPLERRFGMTQGFDHWDDDFESLRGQADVLQSERPAESVTDAVLAYLEGRPTPENLFLFVHYFDPHVPYAAPAPFDTKYDPLGREDLPAWREILAQGLCDSREETEVLARKALQYAAEVSYMDRHVGRLLDGLRERGILDEALLVVTSDHGEDFWQHPTICFDHGWTTYQPATRAVGLVRLPGASNAGARIGALVSSIDILPSVLAYLGLGTPPGVEGEPIDLERAKVGEGDRTRFSEASKPWQREDDPRWANTLKARCVRRGRFKLIQVPYAGREELYDLERDPGELNDLLLSNDPQAQRHAASLRPELERWAASADPLPSEFVISAEQEAIERLKALGYLGE